MANFTNNTSMPAIPSNKRARIEQPQGQSYKRATTIDHQVNGEHVQQMGGPRRDTTQTFERAVAPSRCNAEDDGTSGWESDVSDEAILMRAMAQPVSRMYGPPRYGKTKPGRSQLPTGSISYPTGPGSYALESPSTANHDHVSLHTPHVKCHSGLTVQVRRNGSFYQEDPTKRTETTQAPGAAQQENVEAQPSVDVQSLPQPPISFELPKCMHVALSSMLKSTLVAPFERSKIGAQTRAFARTYVQAVPRSTEEFDQKVVPAIHPKFVPNFQQHEAAVLQPNDVFQFRHLIFPAQRLAVHLEFVALGLIMQQVNSESIWYWRAYMMLKSKTYRLRTEELALHKQRCPQTVPKTQEQRHRMQQWKKVVGFQALNARLKQDGKWEYFSSQNAAGSKRAVAAEGGVDIAGVQKKVRSHGQYTPGREHVVLHNQPPLLKQSAFMASSQPSSFWDFQKDIIWHGPQYGIEHSKFRPSDMAKKRTASTLVAYPRPPPVDLSFLGSLKHSIRQQPNCLRQERYQGNSVELKPRPNMGGDVQLMHGSASDPIDMSSSQQIQSNQEQKPARQSLYKPAEDPWTKEDGMAVWRKTYSDDLVKVPTPEFTALEDYTPDSRGRYKCFHTGYECVFQRCRHDCCADDANGGGLEPKAMIKAIKKSIRTWRAKVEKMIKDGLLDRRHKTWSATHYNEPPTRGDTAADRSRRAEQQVANAADQASDPLTSGGLFAGAVGSRPQQVRSLIARQATAPPPPPQPQTSSQELAERIVRVIAYNRKIYVAKHKKHADLEYFDAWWSARAAKQLGRDLTPEQKFWSQQKKPDDSPDEPLDDFWESYPFQETRSQRLAQAKAEVERNAREVKAAAQAREAEEQSRALRDSQRPAIIEDDDDCRDLFED
ncbi:hypothetical protein DE146DRAFT_779838 [Phaeosphaeria sp. MPI-PUGE-AT-0046c]|nr:hypothetical protein DE146DRAFT_779838 [Phaeosphaeria sp. MPI-PUGE-AT-0046c]